MGLFKSKSKGNRMENKIYKELREIIPDIKKTLGSGNSENDADLISDHFVIEIKHYKSISERQLKNWFMKVMKEASEHNKEPVLIFKENYKPVKVMLIMYRGDWGVPSIVSYESFQLIAKHQNFFSLEVISSHLHAGVQGRFLGQPLAYPL